MQSHGAAIRACMQATLDDGRYLHWNEFRRRPAPEGLSCEQAWSAVKVARAAKVFVPGFVDAHGVVFGYVRVDAIERAVHEWDRKQLVPELVTYASDAGVKQGAHMVSWLQTLMQNEALSSSVFEGAKLATREQGMHMLAHGLAPKDKSERMVLNNMRAMQQVVAMRERPLTREDLLALHLTLTDGALETKYKRAAGRFRHVREDIAVRDLEGQVWFQPPPAGEIEARIAQLLAFANDEAGGAFHHPVVAAIVLHFWMAWVHPFVDGNGRLARALFYWRMLRSGYDVAEYLSISTPLLEAPNAYLRAFLHTETDERDLTYFVLHQLGVLHEAVEAVRRDLHARIAEVGAKRAASKKYAALNDRQVALLERLGETRGAYVTFASHMRTHGVSMQTARTDLAGVEKGKWVRRVRVGHEMRFFGVG